jgi:ABC-2 type transport system permease protein
VSLTATYMHAALALVRRDFALFISYRLRLLSTVFTTVFGLVLFYYISRLVSVGQFDTADEYFAFVVIGMVTLNVLTSTLQTGPSSIRQELVAGTFERMLVSPFGAVASVISMMIFPFLYGMALGLLTLTVADLFFNLSVSWSTSPLAIPVAALGAASFLPFGLIIAGLVIAIKQADSLTAFVVAGMSIVAGLYFPVALLPDWIQWASEVQPFTPSVDLMRHFLIDMPFEGSVAVAVLKLIGFTVILLPLSIGVIAAAIRMGRRRGTVAEY